MTALPKKTLPWIVPELPPTLVEVFERQARCQQLRKGELVLRESEWMDRLVLVRRGLLAEAVVNFELSKPIAMSLFTPGRMVGFLNFFTGTNSPRRILAVNASEILSLPYAAMQAAIDADFALYRELVGYCERADRSELNGMIGLFTLSAEDRLRVLFATAVASSGFDFESGEGLDEWVPVPFFISRADMVKVIYTSLVTLDRILAKWTREEVFRRDGRAAYIKPSTLLPIYRGFAAY